MFASVAGGSDIALDIEDGFFERLLAAPIWRPSILIGRLAGGAVLGAIQSLVFIDRVQHLRRPHPRRASRASSSWSSWPWSWPSPSAGVTAAIGVRTGSQETVQNTFPLIFILLFLSSAFFPTELMAGWYQQVAEANPITWIIDAARELVITGGRGRRRPRASACPAASPCSRSASPPGSSDSGWPPRDRRGRARAEGRRTRHLGRGREPRPAQPAPDRPDPGGGHPDGRHAGVPADLVQRGLLGGHRRPGLPDRLDPVLGGARTP